MTKENTENFVCSNEKLKCNHCPRKCIRANMRKHIGTHIIKGHLHADSYRCGYCGDLGCDISLINSGSVENGTLHPTSHCKYYNKFSYNKTKTTLVKSNPCTNKPVPCEQCKGIFWSYNLAEHYKRMHTGVSCPEMITEDERKLLSS